jgi:hypothetical protein
MHIWHNSILSAAAKYGTNNVVFLTITASPDRDGLLDLGGKDRVDVVTRTFEAIRQEVYQDLIEGKFCPPGKGCRADYAMNVTEWQKRGLPHAHMIAHFPGSIWTANDVRNPFVPYLYACMRIGAIAPIIKLQKIDFYDFNKSSYGYRSIKLCGLIDLLTRKRHNIRA